MKVRCGKTGHGGGQGSIWSTVQKRFFIHDEVESLRAGHSTTTLTVGRLAPHAGGFNNQPNALRLGPVVQRTPRLKRDSYINQVGGIVTALMAN